MTHHIGSWSPYTHRLHNERQRERKSATLSTFNPLAWRLSGEKPFFRKQR
jgi:hypothetical protein